MGFVANFIRFPAVQTFWKSVKIWQQSWRELKGGNFFETQCIMYTLVHVICYLLTHRSLRLKMTFVKLNYSTYTNLQSWLFSCFRDDWVYNVFTNYSIHTASFIYSKMCCYWKASGNRLYNGIILNTAKDLQKGRKGPHRTTQDMTYRETIKDHKWLWF